MELGFGLAQGVRDRYLAEAKDWLRNRGYSRRFCPARDGTHPRGGEHSGILSTHSIGRRGLIVNHLKSLPANKYSYGQRVKKGSMILGIWLTGG
jgi:hypothetical protein